MDLRSSKGLRVTNTIPELGLLVKPLMFRPGKRHRVLDARLLEGDLAHAPDHRLGAIERRGIGELREAHQILLVLRRHESGRCMCEAEVGERDQAAVNEERDARGAHHAADDAHVARREAREEAVEGAEESPE